VQFESIAEFLAMGNHGLYVWLAYGATFAVLVIYVLSLRLRRSKLLRELAWQSSDDAGEDL
jgi:heme exporter protein D